MSAILIESHLSNCVRRLSASYIKLAVPRRSKSSTSTHNHGHDIARRVFSDKYMAEKYWYPPRGINVPLQSLVELEKLPRCAVSLSKRLARFRDIIAVCEQKDIQQLLDRGVRLVLEGQTSFRPSDLLRQGQFVIDEAAKLQKNCRNLPAPKAIQPLVLDDSEHIILQTHHRDRPSLEDRRRTLREFNAFIQGIQARGFAASSMLACQGLHLAAEAHSAASLRLYSQMLVSPTDSPRNVMWNQELGVALSSIRLWLAEDDSMDTEGDLRLSKLSLSIKEYFPQICASLDPVFRIKYLKLVQRFEGARGILSVWERFQRSPHWHALIKNNETDRLSMIVHDIVEQLIVANEPNLAWLVVSGMGWEPGLIQPGTWNLLLDFPEYLTQMRPGMQEVLLQKYEEQIERIEEALNVSWTGGEKGSHVFIDGADDPKVVLKEIEGFLDRKDT